MRNYFSTFCIFHPSETFKATHSEYNYLPNDSKIIIYSVENQRKGHCITLGYSYLGNINPKKVNCNWLLKQRTSEHDKHLSQVKRESTSLGANIAILYIVGTYMYSIYCSTYILRFQLITNFLSCESHVFYQLGSKIIL